MVTGTNLAYIAATGARPVPTATDGVRRGTHATQARPKPTGLDWDALTPTCTGCGTKSGQVASGLCPTCRGVTPTKTKKTKTNGDEGYAVLPEDELLRRFTGPDDTQLGGDLAELESTDPVVAESARRLQDAVSRVALPKDHVDPGALHVDDADSSPAPGVAAPVEHPPVPAEPQASASASAGEDAHDDQQPATPSTDDTTDSEDHTPAYLRRLTGARGQADIDHATEAAWRAADQIDDLERTIPEIVEAATAYDAMVAGIRAARPSPTHTDRPDADPVQAALAAANLDAQIEHAARVLRDTANLGDPAARMLRITALSALDALHLYVEMHLRPTQTAAPVTSTLAGAAQTSTAKTVQRRRVSKLDPHRDQLIAAYKDGDSPTTLGKRYGVSDVAVRKYLAREGVQLRTRAEAQVLVRTTHRTTSTGDPA